MPVDLSSPAESITENLQKAQVKAEYLFYYAYLQPKSVLNPMSPEAAKALIETNTPMFQNLLSALPLAGIVPKRILLQTGGKNYGMHLGRVRTPMIESDPRPRHIADNFYYHQEDAMRAFCTKFPSSAWNVVRPFGIILSYSLIDITSLRHPPPYHAYIASASVPPLKILRVMAKLHPAATDPPFRR